jgi:hypothetical protein
MTSTASTTTAAPDPSTQIQWHNLFWSTLALGVMVWSILSHDLWFLNFVHVVTGLL